MCPRTVLQDSEYTVHNSYTKGEIAINKRREGTDLSNFYRRRPHAGAIIRGSAEHRGIHGIVYFYRTRNGTVVRAEIGGLPMSSGSCDSPVFGFHIHEGSSCTGNMNDPFADVMTHYNPNGCPHPYHAGDMPPLFGCGGTAFQIFLTDSFDTEEIIGKPVVIHSSRDDFTTQPGGDSGEKIACGEIRSLRF